MATTIDSRSTSVLVTGATGYIGGRLVPALLEAGYDVRVLARDPSRLEGRTWLDQVEIIQGDVLDPETLGQALRGINAAYYLIHSMRGGEDFQKKDITAARNFASSARQQGVQRVIYLGGLGDSDENLSEHLRSRQQTGQALREFDVPVTEFRAGVIVGSGSLSFEMIRYLTERIPVMIGPKWVYTHVQPIGIRDALAYLVSALSTPASSGEIIEIGGSDVMTYRDMMLGYAKARGLRRWLIPVPVLTPRLSSYWVHLVTPIPSDIARPLIEGLRNEVIVHSELAQTVFPDIHPVSYDVAVRRALEKLDASEVETRWVDSLGSSQPGQAPAILDDHEGMMLETRRLVVDASPSAIFRAFTSLGGTNGWLYFNWAWRLRGAMDRLVGGVGLRRGRRHPHDLRVGDAIDFWRVEAIEWDKMLRMRAEMKVPGRAWLQFNIEAQGNEKVQLIQTAYFAPRGLFGLLYWYGLYPLHSLIFSGMIRGLAKRAEEVR